MSQVGLRAKLSVYMFLLSSYIAIYNKCTFKIPYIDAHTKWVHACRRPQFIVELHMHVGDEPGCSLFAQASSFGLATPLLSSSAVVFNRPTFSLSTHPLPLYILDL